MLDFLLLGLLGVGLGVLSRLVIHGWQHWGWTSAFWEAFTVLGVVFLVGGLALTLLLLYQNNLEFATIYIGYLVGLFLGTLVACRLDSLIGRKQKRWI